MSSFGRQTTWTPVSQSQRGLVGARLRREGEGERGRGM